MSGAYERVRAGGREIAILRGRAPATVAEAAAASAEARAAILLVHGAGGAARNFFSLLRHLPADAVAIDLPGHGHSAGPGAASIGEAAAIILAAAAAIFPGRRVVLAGHSLGAAQSLSAAAAAEAPGGDGAGRLVAVGAYAAIGAGARLTLGTRLAPIARASFEGFLDEMARSGTPKVTVDQLRETGAETVIRDLDMAAGHSLLGDAARVLVPALVVAGAADAIAPVELCMELWRALPRARFVVEPGASHLVMLDRPRAVARALLGLAEEAVER